MRVDFSHQDRGCGSAGMPRLVDQNVQDFEQTCLSALFLRAGDGQIRGTLRGEEGVCVNSPRCDHRELSVRQEHELAHKAANRFEQRGTLTSPAGFGARVRSVVRGTAEEGGVNRSFPRAP